MFRYIKGIKAFRFSLRLFLKRLGNTSHDKTSSLKSFNFEKLWGCFFLINVVPYAALYELYIAIMS